MCSEARRTARPDWQTGCLYTLFKAPWPVSARDFHAIGRYEMNPLGPGTAAEAPGGQVRFSYSTSIEDFALAPLRKSVVRGSLMYAGLWVESLGANRCKVIYTLSSNPNGSIPTSIVNAANVSQPLAIAQVGKLIKTNPQLVEKIREAKNNDDIAREQQKEEYRQKMQQQKKHAHAAVAGTAAAAAAAPSAAAAAASAAAAAAASPSAARSPAASAAASASPTAAAPATPAPAVPDLSAVAVPLPPSRFDASLTVARRAALSSVTSEGASDGWVFHSRSQEVDIYLRSTPAALRRSAKEWEYSTRQQTMWQ